MKGLASEYTVEVDSFNKDTWFKVLDKFDDANIYQTWSYDEIRCGRDNLSHLVLKKNGQVVAAAQSRIAKIPIINAGIAYVRWGPLWRSHGCNADIEIFAQAVRALRNEYVKKRGLVLRIFPFLYNDESDIFFSILAEEGYCWLKKERRQRTLIIDLSCPPEELRKSLKQKWRNCLNRAEKKNLEVIEGDEDELFEIFIKIYREMLERKNFIEPNDIREFRLIQKDLPSDNKMKIFLCMSNGEHSVGAICTAIGKTGMYLFGATNSIGMKNNGSYLLQWKIIQWLKGKNCLWYDLNGIDPEKNPGTYRFKSGLCGKNGRDLYFLGKFDAYGNNISLYLVKFAEILKTNYGKAKQAINKFNKWMF